MPALDLQRGGRGGERIVRPFAVADFIGGTGNAVGGRQQDVRDKLARHKRVFALAFVPRDAEEVLDGDELLVGIVRADDAGRRAERDQSRGKARGGDELGRSLVAKDGVIAIVALARPACRRRRAGRDRRGRTSTAAAAGFRRRASPGTGSACC